MKRFFLILICVLVLVVFQTSFLAPWFSGYFCPDALLVFLMAGSVIFGFNSVWKTAILSGLLMDLFTYSRIGSHVILFVLAAYAISFISRRLSVSDRGLGLVGALFWIALATWFENWGLVFLENWGNQRFFISAELLRSFAFSALVNVGFFFLGYKYLKKIKKYYHPSEFKFVK